MDRSHRFKREWQTLGLENSPQSEKNIVLGLLEALNDELINNELNIRFGSTRRKLQQYIKDALPTMPTPVQNLGPATAAKELYHLLTLYRMAVRYDGGSHINYGGLPRVQLPRPKPPPVQVLHPLHSHPEEIQPLTRLRRLLPAPGPRYAEDPSRTIHGSNDIADLPPKSPRSRMCGTISPPPGFQATPGPLPAGAHVMGNFQAVPPELLPQAVADSDEPPTLQNIQRPVQKWGALSPFWSTTLKGLSDAETTSLVQQWLQEQERRLESFMVRTDNARARIIDEGRNTNYEMLLGFQEERLMTVEGWRTWIKEAEMWYLAECECVKLPAEKLLADTADGSIMRLAIQQQQEERERLQKVESKLICRSNWVENLHGNPPPSEEWQQLRLWNENGFDFSSSLTLYNVPIDVVRAWASEWNFLSTIYLGQLLVDATDSLQLSLNDMWVNSAYLSIERLGACLQSQGFFEPGQTLWWSPKAFQSADAATGEGQMRLDDQDTFLMAVSFSFAGPWAQFSGPRPIEGRHGPFGDDITPRFTIIVRDAPPGEGLDQDDANLRNALLMELGP